MLKTGDISQSLSDFLNQEVPHILFWGPEFQGKKEKVKEFFENSDLDFRVSDNSVDSLREIVQDSTKVDFIQVIFDLESIQLNSQDALLKVLEETPAGVRFVVTSSSLGLVRPALRSRLWNRYLYRPYSSNDFFDDKSQLPGEDPEMWMNIYSFLKDGKGFDYPVSLLEVKTFEDRKRLSNIFRKVSRHLPRPQRKAALIASSYLSSNQSVSVKYLIDMFSFSKLV